MFYYQKDTRYYSLVLMAVFLSYQCFGKCCNSVKEVAIDEAKKAIKKKENELIEKLKKQGFKDEDIKSISFKIYTDEVIRESIVVLPSEQEIEEAGKR